MTDAPMVCSSRAQGFFGTMVPAPSENAVIAALHAQGLLVKLDRVNLAPFLYDLELINVASALLDEVIRLDALLRERRGPSDFDLVLE